MGVVFVERVLGNSQIRMVSEPAIRHTEFEILVRRLGTVLSYVLAVTEEHYGIARGQGL
ncbi:MAG: hypothetical protein HXP04_05010 [Trueperella pyogenes]|nr:hypothetical protein [Trueperella pyogenes]